MAVVIHVEEPAGGSTILFDLFDPFEAVVMHVEQSAV